MISGLQETESAIRCIEAGAEDYLPKPFDPVLLRARIGACLERKRWRDRERQYLARLRGGEGALGGLAPQHPARPDRGPPERRRDGDCRPSRGGHHPVLRSRRVHGDRGAHCRRAGWSTISTALFSTFDALADALGRREDQDDRRRLHGGRGPAEPRPDHAEAIGGLGAAHAGDAWSGSTRGRRPRLSSGSASTPARSWPASSAAQVHLRRVGRHGERRQSARSARPARRHPRFG